MLLSTLLFPGTGHLVYRRWLRGGLIMVSALVCIIVYIRHSFIQAGIVADKILNGTVDLDVMSIWKALHEGPESGGLLLLAVSIYGILILWVVAAVDVYLISRKDKKRQSVQPG